MIKLLFWVGIIAIIISFWISVYVDSLWKTGILLVILGMMGAIAETYRDEKEEEYEEDTEDDVK